MSTAPRVSTKPWVSEDADFVGDDDFRVVQLTPAGSEASIIFGSGVTSAAPCSVQGIHLIVYGIEAVTRISLRRASSRHSP